MLTLMVLVIGLFPVKECVTDYPSLRSKANRVENEFTKALASREPTSLDRLAKVRDHFGNQEWLYLQTPRYGWLDIPHVLCAAFFTLLIEDTVDKSFPFLTPAFLRESSGILVEIAGVLIESKQAFFPELVLLTNEGWQTLLFRPRELPSLL